MSDATLANPPAADRPTPGSAAPDAGPTAAELRTLWTLDPNVRFLNHGSFGACPRPVLAEQERLRAEMEREPVRFLDDELPARLDAVRERLGAFLGSRPADLVFVPNASEGVMTVLRSLRLAPGDEIVMTDHGYAATRWSAEVVAAERGARVVVAKVPFPLAGPDEVVAPIAAALGPRTRLLLVDHVTSATGLVFPVRAITDAARAAGVEVLVDGAHAAGMVDLDVPATGATWYTGNCHKWLCTPKGSAYLWVREDRQDELLPLVVSHGWRDGRPGSSRFHALFDWRGTVDPTPWLAIPAALDCLGSLLPGGWPALRARNHALVVRAREHLLAALGIPAPAPASMLGSLASVPLPPGPARTLHEALLAADFEVPVHPWPAPPARLLRVAAQVYNDESEYAALAAALPSQLAAAG